MHGAHSNAIVMRRPDGSPMTRQEVIVRRRGALKWLPVLCSNDLVHGSWWFTLGSFFMGVSAIYPLIQKYIGLYNQTDDIMPATDQDITWAMLIVSGAFFTLGSIAFVHAFEEPPQRAFFYNWKHAQTDELLASWMFLFGTVPAVPYMLVFFAVEPSAFYFFGLVAAIAFVVASYLFVLSCYPSEKKVENYCLPLCIHAFGAQMWVVKHLANDWLAATWFFLWANLLLTFASFLMLLIALGIGNPAQVFIWLTGTISSFLFLIGSAYFVSGSYPHASQFYYATDRGKNDGTTPPTEVFADEIGLVAPPSVPHIGSGATDLLATTMSSLSTTVTSTVVNPFHLNSAEAERAKRMAGKRRSVYGGSVTKPGTGQGGAHNPLHKGIRAHAAGLNLDISSMTKPVAVQSMEERGEEVSEGTATTVGKAHQGGYVKLVNESVPDLMNNEPTASTTAASSIISGNSNHNVSQDVIRDSNVSVTRAGSASYIFTAAEEESEKFPEDDEDIEVNVNGDSADKREDDYDDI